MDGLFDECVRSFLTTLSIQRMPFSWCTVSYSNARSECLRRKQKQKQTICMDKQECDGDNCGRLKRDRDRNSQWAICVKIRSKYLVYLFVCAHVLVHIVQCTQMENALRWRETLAYANAQWHIRMTERTHHLSLPAFLYVYTQVHTTREMSIIATKFRTHEHFRLFSLMKVSKGIGRIRPQKPRTMW